MKSIQSRFWLSISLVLLGLLFLVGCTTPSTPAALPIDLSFQLPIDFIFAGDQAAATASLLGSDIAFLGSAPEGSVYAGARKENASLVVVRWFGHDYFYSLKGLLLANLQQVVCRVECDITVSLVEGADILIVVRSIDVNKKLETPKVIWQNPVLVQTKPGSAIVPTATLAAGQPTPTPFAPVTGKYECTFLPFKKGTQALTLVPLKMRSSPELPENFNSNVISYMNAGEKVDVLNDSQGEWINIKKASGETGYSKQCTTLNGRFLQPGQ